MKPDLKLALRKLKVQYLMAFYLLGLLQTVIAYLAFSRADDHQYFLRLANEGVSVIPFSGQDLYDFKARSAGLIFYLIATPSRWFGGAELTHIMWLRIVNLFGCVVAFNWIFAICRSEHRDLCFLSALRCFCLLFLVYPGQLAWTASLLRDGVATTFFFFGLSLFKKSLLLLLSLFCFLVCFSMRPEYAIISIVLVCAWQFRERLRRIRFRGGVVFLLILLFTVVVQPIQFDSSQFAQYAFAEDGNAYPVTSGRFDLVGYSLIFVQGLIDPISLQNVLGGSPFYMAEAIFFIAILICAGGKSRNAGGKMFVIWAVVAFCLWTFAYFELFVGGYTRHRLPLVIVLLSWIASMHMVRKQKISYEGWISR